MIARLLTGCVRFLCGCNARWAELPVAGPRVYYANHTSHLDSLLLWSALPAQLRRSCRIVAAADYWERTRARRWLAREVFRAVLIDRTTVTRRNNPLDHMLAVLDAGEALVIFPEGGRSDRQVVRDFRSGIWHMARRRPDLPFVPVWLENLSRVLPKGEVLPVPLMTAVAFGAAFHKAADDTKEIFLDRARRRLLALRREPDPCTTPER